MSTARQQVIDLMKARGAVVAGSPYSTSIGQNVLVARSSVGVGDVPCMVIQPGDDAAVKEYGTYRVMMPFSVEGIVEFASSDPSIVGEAMLGDIIKCFTDRSWSRSPEIIESLDYVGGAVGIVKDGEVTVGAVAKFNVTFIVANGDPTVIV